MVRGLKIISAVIVLLVIVIAAFYLYLPADIRTHDLPVYYQNLADMCREKVGFSCCMSSVEIMAAGNYTLVVGGMLMGDCPDGFVRNMLKCVDSYAWCEPIE